MSVLMAMVSPQAHRLYQGFLPGGEGLDTREVLFQKSWAFLQVPEKAASAQTGWKTILFFQTLN